MKAVLLSVQPKWCELIASGEKTIEVRKTKPKLETPFKVYIYMTKDVRFNTFHSFNAGKVIGEFACDEVEVIGYTPYLHGQYEPLETVKKTCVPQIELFDYLKGEYGFGWHISDLVIYDKPKELSEFKRINRSCYYSDLGLAIPDCDRCKEPDCMLQKAPRSWCYVESMEENE